jgi:hypothetical protein
MAIEQNGKTFTLKGLAPNATYIVEVLAVPKDGKPSAWSKPIKFRTNTKDVPPPPVTDLVVSFDGSGFTASWDGSAALAEKDFAYFKVTLTSPDFPLITKVYAAQSQSFSLDYDSMLFAFGGVANPIVIEVKSVDRSGNESSGVSETGGNPPPAAPQNVSVAAEIMGYRVSWDTPEETDYSYTKIYESSTVSGTYTAIENVTATPSSIKVVGYSTRYIKVSHVDTFGGESELAPTTGIEVTPLNPVTVDTTPPDQRTSISYTPGAGFMEISWANPSGTVNEDLAGITVRYARTASPTNYTWVNIPFTYSSPLTSVAIGNLLPLTSYDFSISTFDKTQNRTSYSTTSTQVTLGDTTPPPRPKAPTVTAGSSAGGPMLVIISQESIEHGTSTALPLDIADVKVFMLNSGYSSAPGTGVSANANASEIGMFSAAYNGGTNQGKIYVPLEQNEQRYFYTRITDTSGNISDASPAVQSSAMTVFSSAYISSLTADKITAGRINANEYIQVGTSSEQITIKSTSALGQIFSGTGTYNNTNTGIYIDTSGKFSLKNRLLFDGTDLTVTGTINAKGGTFDGNVKIQSPGSIYVGSAPDSGARLIMNANGLTAYNTSGTSTFTLNAATGDVSISGYIQTGGAEGDITTISGNKVRTGSIESVGYVAPAVGSNFAQAGAKFDLSNAEIRATNFYVAGGNATFLGEVRATSGYFGDSAYGWLLTNGNDPTYGNYTEIKTDTLRLVSDLTGSVRNGSIQFLTTAGGVIGELNTTASSKNFSGLGSGLVLGTTLDYLFLPGSGNSNRARIYTNGFDFYGPTSGFLMRINNNGINLAGDSDINFYNADASAINASINYQPSTSNLVITSDGQIRLVGTALKFNGVDVGTGGGSSGVSSFNTRTGAVTLTDADIQDLGAISGLGLLTGSGFRNSSATTTVEAWYGTTASAGSLPSAANYPSNTILVVI